MSSPRFITAIGTPLDQNDQIHHQGLAAHLNDLHHAGIDGLLVAGTMGLMQLLTDQVWRDLVEQSIKLGRGRFEMLIGAGDCSFARTQERIEYLNTCQGVDGIVLISPYFIKFSQEELIAYFQALADVARYPVYLYDLPALTGVHLENDTVAQLAKHPNIAGIKCSCDINESRQIHDRFNSDAFRVIIAQPKLSDMLFRHGIDDQLDGIYILAPHWATQLSQAAATQQWDKAHVYQTLITDLLNLVTSRPIFPTVTAIMNARGIPGRFSPRPFSDLSDQDREELLELPLIKQLIEQNQLVAM